ncbi:MAG TPA: phosphoribosyltransferase family protein [Flavipsychrobacter sp.]|nr:phosphoribosyltransferase family protein [Flavipsychrobacter sp.]
MEDKRILILDEKRIGHKLQRMAFEVWEHNSNEKAVTLVGIQGGGLAVAENLAERLRTISGMDVDVVNIKMNKRNPLAEDIVLEKDLSGRSVILVDDVANSGKTLLYALKPLLNYELKKIMIAVLVDRKHKAFPVSPDIVGHSIATTIQEHILVETSNNEVKAAYLQ